MPGPWTPSLHEGAVRLGTWMPFPAAAQLLAAFTHTAVSEPTVRRQTEAAGAAYVALQTAAAEALEQEGAAPPPGPAVLQVSVDGAMVPLVGRASGPRSRRSPSAWSSRRGRARRRGPPPSPTSPAWRTTRRSPGWRWWRRTGAGSRRRAGSSPSATGRAGRSTSWTRTARRRPASSTGATRWATWARWRAPASGGGRRGAAVARRAGARVAGRRPRPGAGQAARPARRPGRPRATRRRWRGGAGQAGGGAT